MNHKSRCRWRGARDLSARAHHRLWLGLAVFVVSGFLLTSSASSLSLSVKGASSQTSTDPVFVCPNQEGVCALDEGGHWRQLWTSLEGRHLSDFKRSSDGRLILLLRGHQSDGTVVVLSSEGALEFSRGLMSARSLEEVYSEGPAGALVLCNASSLTSFCDVAVLPKGATTLPEFMPLPEGCVFPRFGDDELPVCLQSTPNTTIMFGTREGRYRERQLQLHDANINDFESLGGGAFAILAGGRVVVSAEDGLHEVGDHGAQKLFRLGKSVYEVACVPIAEPDREQCELARLDKGAGREVLWRFEGFVPVSVQTFQDGQLVVELRRDAERRIVSLGSSQDGRGKKTLWSSHSNTAPGRVPD